MSIRKPMWSEPTHGLAGRVLVELEDLHFGLRHAVTVELRNDLLEPVAVTAGPAIHAELYNSLRKPVAVSSLPVSGPEPIPRWGVIPRDAYIGFRIDMQNAGVPARERGKVLLAISGKMWELGAGSFVLEITLRFESQKDGPANQWTGALILPPVDVVVTPQALALRDA